MLKKETVLRNDTLIIGDEENYIIYSPFTKLITRVAEFPEKNKEKEKSLKKHGFFQKPPESIKKDKKWTGFNSLTLLVTRKCNLSCVYCYACPLGKGPSMSVDLAKNSLKWFLKHRINQSQVKITFHGGGEPTLEKNLIEKVVAEVEKSKKENKIRYLIVTNGTCNKAFLKWLVEKKFAISISADGPPDIQDRNRPFLDGSGSSKIVESNIKYLVSVGHPPGIRVTYSMKDDIVRIVKYFGDLGVKNLHLEPLFPFGRNYDDIQFGKKSKYEIFSPSSGDFLKEFFKAIDTCKEYKMRIFNSHTAHFSKGLGYFCGAAHGCSMLVTHDGLLTGCLEVVDSKDEDMSLFKIGEWNSENQTFDLDIGKISLLQKRHVNSLGECKDCFARYTCAGGCAVKAVRASGDLFKKETSYCSFTKSFVSAFVKKIAKINKI